MNLNLYQALFPIRGKILNCLKASKTQILASEVISDIINLLGTGIEVPLGKGKKADFDIEKLKWDKVVICTDADYDGFQIRCLLLSFFYSLTPSLLNSGKIYIAETPLYEIDYPGQSEPFFAYSDDEKDTYLKGKDIKKAKIQRSKGLGGLSPLYI